MPFFPPFSVPSKVEMTSLVQWDVVKATKGLVYLAPGIPDDARQLLTQPGHTMGRLIGLGAFASVYHVTDHPEYVVKEALRDQVDPDLFSKACGFTALRMNVALSHGLAKLPNTTLSSGKNLVTPKYYGASDDGNTFRVVMSFEQGTPIYAGNPAAGTHDERRLILDAAMIAGGAEPPADGKYDDEPSAGYTNLVDQPDPNGPGRVVLLDASSIVKGNLEDDILWLL